MSHLKVFLWNKEIGSLRWDPDSLSADFAYHPDFINSGIQIAPLRMPLSNEIYNFRNLPRKTFNGLPGMISDSLPDRYGKALIDTYFKSKNYVFEDLSSLDLLAYVGSRGMGALEYKPSHDIDVSEGKIDIEELKQLARYGLEKAEGFTTEIHPNDAKGFEDILIVGTSAGGARAKAVIAYNPISGEVRSGQLDLGKDFQHWLIKLDVGKGARTLDKPQGYGVSEYVYYRIAQLAEIRMAICKLMEDGDRRHFMTKRFDRDNGEKLHMTTLTGLTHIDYEDVSSHSYNDLFGTARFLSVPYKDMEQLYRQMVFNVVMSNCDDHTKNFSFMMNKQDLSWRVTPAYDLAYSYDPTNLWVKDHMLIQGKRRGITFNDMVKEGEKHGIRNPKKIVKQVLEASSQFTTLAKEEQMIPEMAKKIQNRLNEVYQSLELPKQYVKPKTKKDRGMSF